MSAIITEPSICIPRTLSNVTWKDVKDVFEQLIGPGTVERVDLVKGKAEHDANTQFCRIFVHFRTWPVHNPEVSNIRDRLLAGETIKLVYDNPWFWKCVQSRVDKPQRTRIRHAPFIRDCESSPRAPPRLDDLKSPEPTPVDLDTPPPAPNKESARKLWSDDDEEHNYMDSQG